MRLVRVIVVVGTMTRVLRAEDQKQFAAIDDRDPTEPPAVWCSVNYLDNWDDNPRINDDAAEDVAGLIIEYGFAAPMTAWPDPKKNGRLRLIAGHTRKKAVFIVAERYEYGLAHPEQLEGWHPGAIEVARNGLVPVRIRGDLTLDQANELALADNKSSEKAEWDNAKLSALLQHMPDGRALKLGWDTDELSRLLGTGKDDDADVERATASLAERFTVPPFSVLDARQGYWKDRKKAWIDLGLKSYMGRENVRTVNNAAMVAELRKAKPSSKLVGGKTQCGDGMGNPIRVPTKGLHLANKLVDGKIRQGDSFGVPLGESTIQTTLSIFDPVLAELAYRWFCPPGGSVLDPFAGGSVRGLVAHRLGLRYTGIDLRPEQVAANDYQAQQIGHRFANPIGSANWVTGDSASYLADPNNGPRDVDLVFTCPPYMDLETYSDDPLDLSAMSAADFWKSYRAIIQRSYGRLAGDRFAVWVIGEVRDPKGIYRSFVPKTIQAFIDAGFVYYNEAILVTSLNSVPLRAAKQFVVGRKLCRTHQTVLVFVKGDVKAAVAACGDVSNCMPDDLTQFVDGGDADV
jgi:ParB-like chromosome segregation protein Spo0J